LGILGRTHISSMEDKLVAGHGPALPGNDLHQLKFDFIRVFRLGPAQPMGHSFHMRIHGDGLLAVRVTQDDVGRLSAYSGKRNKLFQRSGTWPLNRSTIIRQQVRMLLALLW